MNAAEGSGHGESSARRYWLYASQPTMFPPVYWVARLARVDKFVVLDDVQFSRDHTNFRLEQNEKPVDVVVPVKNGGRKPFSGIELHEPERLKEKLMRQLQIVYGKRAGWLRLRDDFEQLLLSSLKSGARFNDFAAAQLCWILRILHLRPEIHRASQIQAEGTEVHGAGRLVHLCKALGATDYLQGSGLMSYASEEQFKEAHVRAWIQALVIPRYRGGDGTATAGVSILDPLFWDGVEGTRELIKAEGGPGESPDMFLWA